MQPFFQLSQVSTTPVETELRLGIADNAVTIVSATIRGPFCEYASTLPATIPFRRTQKEAEFLKATVPDPCYWTPSMPHLYCVEAQYRYGRNQMVKTVRFERGLCRCEIRNNALYIDGERTVIRGIGWSHDRKEPDWAELRATRTSLIISKWDDEFATKCSKHGILMFLIGLETQLVNQQGVIGDHPAFLGSIATKTITDSNRGNENKYQARVTLVTQSSKPIAASNQIVFAVLDEKNSSADDWKQKRKACDALQAEVAAIGDLAGYIVL